MKSVDVSQYGVTWYSNKAFNCGVMGFRNEKLRDAYIKCHQEVVEIISNNSNIIKILRDRRENPELVVEQQFVTDITNDYTKKFILNGHDINWIAKRIGYRHYICQSKYSRQQEIRDDLKSGDINMYNIVSSVCVDVKDRAKFLDCLKPKGTDVPLKLYGTPGDGSYYMYPRFREGPVLSIGVGDNVNWDLAIAEEPAVEMINMYDGTINNLPCNNDKFIFYKHNVGINKYNDEVRIENILTENTHVLKMDIEGGEYDVLWNEAIYENIDQLVVEFHDLLDIHTPFENIINIILKYMVPIYCHTNNFSEYKITENGIIPDTLEITFLKKDYCVFNDYASPPYYRNCPNKDIVERFG